MSDNPDNLFRHYKGGLYRLLLEATDEVTGKPYYVYRSEADGRVWVRSAENWNSTVHEEVPGGRSTRIPRFAKVWQP